MSYTADHGADCKKTKNGSKFRNDLQFWLHNPSLLREQFEIVPIFSRHPEIARKWKQFLEQNNPNS